MHTETIIVPRGGSGFNVSPVHAQLVSREGMNEPPRELKMNIIFSFLWLMPVRLTSARG